MARRVTGNSLRRMLRAGVWLAAAAAAWGSALAWSQSVDLEGDFARLRDQQYFLRIGIGQTDGEKSSVRVVCNTDFVLQDRDGKVLWSGPGETPLRFVRHGGEGSRGRVEAFDATGKAVADANGFLSVRPKSRQSLTRARTLRGNYADWAQPGAWLTSDNPAYRGQIEVWASEKSELTIVNRVFLEHYVYSVVPVEIGTNVSFEMKKVQAVITRSEAIAKLHEGNHKGEPFDYCNGSDCQVYNGALAEDPECDAAVDASWGQVVTHGNHVADAVYSECCGGLTAASQDVWGGESMGHLQRRLDQPDEKGESAPDLSSDEAARKFLSASGHAFCNPSAEGYPPDVRATNFRWDQTLSAASVAEDVRRDNKNVGRVTDLHVARRSPSGRVLGLDVKTDTRGTLHVTGEMAIRRVMGLKSTFFVIDCDYDTEHRLSHVHVRGGGYGHGVGLCQTGARTMAARGADYITILQHYFTDSAIYRIYR
jgi:SpoIID/LytB domain protein